MKKRISAFFFSLLFLLVPSCSQYSPEPWVPEDSGSAVSEETFVPQAQEGDLTVVFLDVGQGDCTFIKSGEECMLIDCGDRSTFSHVEEILKQYHAEELRYFAATHDHSDHVGASEMLLETIPVREIMLSPARNSGGSGDYEKMQAAAAEKGIRIREPQAGETFSLGSSQICVLAPLEREPEDINNASLVFRISCGSVTVLAAADAERESERQMVLSQEALCADVLLVGHHGSGSSSSYSFLHRVLPRYAVISVGAENSYGHPSRTVLDRLSRCAAELYRTDLHGDICFIVQDDAVSVETQTDYPAVPPSQQEAEREYYIGNRKSMILHAPDCKNLPSEKNRVIYGKFEDAIGDGFSPCAGCNP